MSMSTPPGTLKTRAMREKIPTRVAQAAAKILAPLAQLFVAHGLKFGDAEKLLKQAFYEAGLRELSRAGIQPNVSRLSVSTGLHRKDVKVFTESSVDTVAGESVAAQIDSIDGSSAASRLYTRWSTEPDYRVGNRLRDLPLRAESGQPSFDALAREISNDAHPRAMLEELKRLGLVDIDDGAGLVRLKPGGFIPLFERTEMLALLGDNLADHLETAVGNVISNTDKRLEQAVFMDSLSTRSIEQVQLLARRLWSANMRSLVRSMTRLGEADSKAAHQPTYRIRVGMYFYSDRPRDDPASPNAPMSDKSDSPSKPSRRS